MSKFSRTPVNLSKLDPKIDSGISVKDALELIENSEYKDDLTKLFNIESISEDFINIIGASNLVKSILIKDEEFTKINIDNSLNDISISNFNDSGSINIKIKQSENESNDNYIDAETIYSAKSDFLDDLFHLGKFSDFCNKNSCNELIDNNIEYLKIRFGSDKTYNKRYRILKDKENKYYLRAITSTGRYHDYNIRVSVFIALIVLHLSSKASGQNYRIKNYIYNESYINVYFEKQIDQKIGDFGKARFVIELSNDEVKKEALKFSGIYNIYTEEETNPGSFYIKSNSSKSNILSIKHSITPTNVVETLNSLQENTYKVENEMFDDILCINNIKKPDQIRHLLKTKIDSARIDEIQKYKSKLSNELVTKIDNIYQLLKLMDKLYLIISESDIEAKEYLMYLLYDSMAHNNKDIEE